MDRRRLLRLTGTIAIAAAGGWLATLVGLPASWLSGSMICAAFLTIAGFESRLPARFADGIFLLMGTAFGAGLTPELIANAAAWPFSLAVLAATIVVGIVAVRAFLMRVAGWDRETAFFAAVPGALSYVLAIASETNADMRKVAASQSIRVFLLVAALPGIVVAVEPGGQPGREIAVASYTETFILLAASLTSSLVLRRLGMPAAFLLGSFAASAALHGTGTIVGTLPTPVVTSAIVLLGVLIGSRFTGITPGFLRMVLAASAGAFIVVTAIALSAALLVAFTIGVPVDQAIIAFAPGGLDAMLSLALALDMDTTFVAAHQFARFVGLALMLPIVTRWAVGGR
ncbi:MAG: AbrB family transcriptional regulator [Hyphomicrobiales bacterium]|nr:AbrB family transcriptional regulator [Hyphomicrobiales bacterium]